MKSLICLMFSVITLAGVSVYSQTNAPLQVYPMFVSDSSAGVSKYTLQFTDEGQLRVIIDPNTCSGNPPYIACTTMGKITRTVYAKLAEGDLARSPSVTLNLSKGLALRITSENRVTKSVSVLENVGQSNQTEVPLEPTFLIYEKQ